MEADNNIMETAEAGGNKDSGCSKWGILIAILVLLNILSWAFDWGWWFY